MWNCTWNSSVRHSISKCNFTEQNRVHTQFPSAISQSKIEFSALDLLDNKIVSKPWLTNKIVREIWLFWGKKKSCCRCEFRLILNLLEIKIHNAVENIWSVSITQFLIFIIYNSKIVGLIAKRLFGKSITLFPSLNYLIFELWVMETENTFWLFSFSITRSSMVFL